MLPSRPFPTLLCVALLTAGIAGCGDDGPTTTSSAAPSALDAQGARGGAATDVEPLPSPGPLERYALEGETASASRAAPVLGGFRAFAKAVLDRDAARACEQVVGFEELLRARGQQGDCETLLPAIGNTSAGPSARDLDLIATADAVIVGDRATISVGSAAPVPMRRVDGAWKLDYAAFAAAPKGP